jgi:hypothetical protein
MQSTTNPKEHTMKRLVATLALVISVAVTITAGASAQTPKTFHGGSVRGSGFHVGSVTGRFSLRVARSAL